MWSPIPIPMPIPKWRKPLLMRISCVQISHFWGVGSVGLGCAKKNLEIASSNVKQCSYHGNDIFPLKKITHKIIIESRNSTSGYIPQRNESRDSEIPCSPLPPETHAHLPASPIHGEESTSLSPNTQLNASTTTHTCFFSQETSKGPGTVPRR